jgi:hypothetical protein
VCRSAEEGSVLKGSREHAWVHRPLGGSWAEQSVERQEPVTQPLSLSSTSGSREAQSATQPTTAAAALGAATLSTRFSSCNSTGCSSSSTGPALP